jgi:hypothetical protein
MSNDLSSSTINCTVFTRADVSGKKGVVRSLLQITAASSGTNQSVDESVTELQESQIRKSKVESVGITRTLGKENKTFEFLKQAPYEQLRKYR